MSDDVLVREGVLSMDALERLAAADRDLESRSSSRRR